MQSERLSSGNIGRSTTTHTGCNSKTTLMVISSSGVHLTQPADLARQEEQNNPITENTFDNRQANESMAERQSSSQISFHQSPVKPTYLIASNKESPLLKKATVPKEAMLNTSTGSTKAALKPLILQK